MFVVSIYQHYYSNNLPMLQVLVMDSGCSTVKSSEIVVVDDAAARADGMAIVDGRAVSDVAVKGSGTAVADDATIKADALQVVFLSLSSIHSLWLLLSFYLSQSLCSKHKLSIWLGGSEFFNAFSVLCFLVISLLCF